jgi:hypothetical protein
MSGDVLISYLLNHKLEINCYLDGSIIHTDMLTHTQLGVRHEN